MPAYNAAATLRQTVADIPAGSVSEVVLVDDGSRDNTVEIARELGLTVIVHEKNVGYGGNQKTCYRQALASGADFIVMIHPDYQYDSRVIPVAVEILRLGICDCVLGSRIRTRAEALAGGMPIYKYISNRLLTIAENVATVTRLLGWSKDRQRQRADELLGLVGLDPGKYRDRYPSQLSGGERQRVAVSLDDVADVVPCERNRPGGERTGDGVAVREPLGVVIDLERFLVPRDHDDAVMRLAPYRSVRA